MATLKQRLHRKNSSGTYDTIHFETSADLIVGSVPIANGGTGATTAAAARTNLGITPANIGAAASSHTHTAANITGLTASKAVVTNSSGNLTSAAVTSTELGYLDGVKSAIQTQLNGKAATSHNHSASNITSGTLPVARGGTGVTSSPSLLVNLAATTAASVFATSPRPGVTGTLPISKGGTGVTSLSSLKSALGISSINPTIACGTGTTGSSSGRTTVYFSSSTFINGSSFTSTPFIFVTAINNMECYAISVYDASTTQFSVSAGYRIDGGTTDSDRTDFYWIAIQFV